MLSTVVLLTLLPASSFAAPGTQDSRTEELAPERLEALIEALAREIEENYVFPDVAQRIGERLREQLYAGAYEGIAIEAVASRLTTDARSVNGDKHLQVERLEQRPSEPPPDRVELERQWAEEARRSNFGFQKVEILDGNIGYLELLGFAPLESARDTAAAAMAFLANVDALIIDVRANGGGHPSMIQFLCSYFFAEPTHLNSYEWRGREGLEEFWTFAEVPGKRLLDCPLFVLTSRGTFSAAEEFTYDLRNLGRATIVGETTGGGAHPGGTHEIEGLLQVFIPQGRAINPITKTNWEGTGVEPHVQVPADRALDTAKQAAREAIQEQRGRTQGS
jgi:C-terminal processing protease CtpA/Prc